MCYSKVLQSQFLTIGIRATEPASMATNNQYYLEQILESLREMRELLGFKTEPKHDRTILICGATQDDDCLCVVAESLVQGQLLDPVIKDNGDEVSKEKIVDPISLNNQVGEPLKQVKAQSDLTQIITEHERKVLICGYTEAEDCFCVATEVMKSEYDLDVVDVEFFANLNGLSVASKVFDGSSERDGYIPTLKPKPPDESENLILASDPDHEGEAIAWHIIEMLKQQDALREDIKLARVVFNEITESSIKNVLLATRVIDVNLVHAYLVRRALNYLIGFNISPLLWRKLPGCQSAGRVQSAALSLICDREMEIDGCKPQEYWIVDVEFNEKGLGSAGLITYIRTDGLNISNEACKNICSYDRERYGHSFASKSSHKYFKKVKNAQEAHDAIRPTDIRRVPSNMVGILDEDSLKLYTLIWSRTLACQMELAMIDQIQIDIWNADRSIIFRFACSRIEFPGYQTVYEGNKHAAVFGVLSNLKSGDRLYLGKIELKQYHTQPPLRFTEGSLVKNLEEFGIEFRGRMVSAFLSHHFSEVTDYSFTVLLLTGFLATTLMRVLKNGFVKYAHDEETAEDQEETGGKYIHGDVFRYPKYKSVFVAVLGFGTQLFAIAILVFMLALVRDEIPSDGRNKFLVHIFDPGGRSNPYFYQYCIIDLRAYGGTIDTKYYTPDVSLWMAHLHDEFSVESLPMFDRLAALVMVFDMNDLSSLVALKEWVSRTDIQNFDIFLCIGNKVDLLPVHSAHVEYRRHLRKLGESWGNTNSELDYGIFETKGSSLLGDEELLGEIKNSCLEWCYEHNIEYVEVCASNADFDKCLTVDGYSQGVDRLYGAFSAHMWPGMILKSGNKIIEPSLPRNKSCQKEKWTMSLSMKFYLLVQQNRVMTPMEVGFL